jgi:hypothetical protein
MSLQPAGTLCETASRLAGLLHPVAGGPDSRAPPPTDWLELLAGGESPSETSTRRALLPTAGRRRTFWHFVSLPGRDGRVQELDHLRHGFLPLLLLFCLLLTVGEGVALRNHPQKGSEQQQACKSKSWDLPDGCGRGKEVRRADVPSRATWPDGGLKRTDRRTNSRLQLSCFHRSNKTAANLTPSHMASVPRRLQAATALIPALGT